MSDRTFEVVKSDSGFKGGRYVATGPYAAALHAIAEMCRERKQRLGCKDLKFTIRETTRGSKHKQYSYIGNRVKVDNLIELKTSGSKTKKVNFAYRYTVKSVKNTSS
jgi:hypothetical protein